MRNTPLFLVVASTLALCAGTARAQAARGSLRLDLTTPFLSVDHFPDLGDPSLQLGVWFADLNGALRPGLVLGGAYMPADALVMGARLGFGVASMPSVLGSRSMGLFSLQPFAEYLFLQGDIRPYAGIEAGLQLVTPERSDVLVHGRVVATGGVHFFALEGLSLTPGLALGYVHNGPERAGGMEMLLTFTLAGWIPIAGERRAPPSVDAEAAPAVGAEAAPPTGDAATAPR